MIKIKKNIAVFILVAVLMLAFISYYANVLNSTYIFYSAIMLVSSFYYLNDYNKKNQKLRLIGFLFFCFPMAMGYGMSMDWRTYNSIFYYIKDNFDIAWRNRFGGIEIGYILFNKLLSFFLSEYYYIQIVIILISFFLLFKGIMKHEKINVGVFIFLFFLNTYFKIMCAGLIRMNVAICLFPLAIYYLQKKDIKKYILVTIIALLFHLSAIFWLFYLVLLLDKLKYRKIIVVGLQMGIIVTIKKILPIFVSFLGIRYSGYGEKQFDITFDINSLLRLLIFIMFLYLRRYIETESRYKYDNLLMISVTGLLIDVFLNGNAIARLQYYTDIAMLILISCYENFKMDGNKKMIVLAFSEIYYSIVFLMTIILSERAYVSLFPFATAFFYFK